MSMALSCITFEGKTDSLCDSTWAVVMETQDCYFAPSPVWSFWCSKQTLSAAAEVTFMQIMGCDAILAQVLAWNCISSLPFAEHVLSHTKCHLSTVLFLLVSRWPHRHLAQIISHFMYLSFCLFLFDKNFSFRTNLNAHQVTVLPWLWLKLSLRKLLCAPSVVSLWLCSMGQSECVA